MSKATRAIIMALAVCGFDSTASAARYSFDDPITPPAQNLARGLAIYDEGHGPVRVQQEPLDRVQALCDPHNVEPRTITGCSYADASVGWFLIIIIQQIDVTPEFWTATFQHELGHVGGWPAHHPS